MLSRLADPEPDVDGEEGDASFDGEGGAWGEGEGEGEGDGEGDGDGEGVDGAVQGDFPGAAVSGEMQFKTKAPRRQKAGDDTIKRPTTTWIEYCQFKRQELLGKNPKMNFAELAKAMSEGFKNMSEAERLQLNDICEKDKERYKNELIARGIDPATVLPKQRNRAGGGPGRGRGKKVAADGVGGGEEGDQFFDLPLAKVKKIMKLDPEVKQLASDAILAVTRCTELFLASLLTKSLEASERRGTKTVHLVDVLHTVQTRDCFEFLRLDLRRGVSDVGGGLDGAGVGSGRSTSGGEVSGDQPKQKRSYTRRDKGGSKPPRPRARSSNSGSASARGESAPDLASFLASLPDPLQSGPAAAGVAANYYERGGEGGDWSEV